MIVAFGPSVKTAAGNPDLFSRAINKDGVIRGNYYNSLTDLTVPLYGSVDKKMQRAAWIVGDKKDTVYETGVGNLSQPETSMLVHIGKDRTQQWILVRLEPPSLWCGRRGEHATAKPSSRPGSHAQKANEPLGGIPAARWVKSSRSRR